MFDIIGKRNWFFALSLAVTIPGLIFILLGPITGGKVGLQFAIDFTGGTEWSIRFQDAAVTAQQVKDVLRPSNSTPTSPRPATTSWRSGPRRRRSPPPAPSPTPLATAAPSASAARPLRPARLRIGRCVGLGRPSVSVAPSASVAPSPSAVRRRVGVRVTSPAPSGSAAPGASPSASPGPPRTRTCRPTASSAMRKALEAALGPIAEQRSLSTVGAVVSSDLITQALMLILVGSIGILLWITYRFRDFKMGVTALVALLHDVIVVVGMFAILGTFFGLQIDSLFVTALLTIIGFSVHDTIVVFDRIRENRSRHAGEPFDRIVNHSVLQTFGRSINTSLTVVITLLALLLFAGEAIGTFVLALLLGIISGTYSSIFNASPLLVVWHQWEDRKRLREIAARPGRRSAT